MKNLIAPFDAYKGREPYIFISYAHRNSSIVFRHITRLREEGFRIWYDEGIDPGTDWSDEIARALSGAAVFLVFVSPEMVASHNVKKEIVFALSRRKPMFAVHVVDTILPDGLDMQLSNIQALFEGRFNDREKFYERLIAALPQETRGKKPSATDRTRHSGEPRRKSWWGNLFGGNGPETAGEPRIAAVEESAPQVEPKKVAAPSPAPVATPTPAPTPPPVSKPAERQVAQPGAYSNTVQEDGVLSFIPSGTLTIKTTSGEEYNAILNTVSGFPLRIDEQTISLDDFKSMKFDHRKTDDSDTITIRTLNAYGDEKVIVENLSSMYFGPISFLSDKGYRYLSMRRIESFTKDETATPPMPENTIYVYIRTGGMVYKVPGSLLRYKRGFGLNAEKGEGILNCGGDIYGLGSLKYIRICKENRPKNDTASANVYFTDGSHVSSSLCGTVIASTVLGEVQAQVSQIDEIFFGTYDVDYAKSVASDVWDGSKPIPLMEHGSAIVHKTDGTQSVLELASLVAVGDRLASSSAYFKTDSGLFHAESEDRPPLFFAEIRHLTVKTDGKYPVAEYTLRSGETGVKPVIDFQIEGLSKKGKEEISVREIERIEFTDERADVLPGLKMAHIVDSYDQAYETPQAMLYFRYPGDTIVGVRYNNEQNVKIAGGLSIAYDKISKIEFLPERKDGDKWLYPAKITFRAGGSQEFMLDIAGYHPSYLQFPTCMGVCSFYLRGRIKSIEFLP